MINYFPKFKSSDEKTYLTFSIITFDNLQINKEILPMQNQEFQLNNCLIHHYIKFNKFLRIITYNLLSLFIFIMIQLIFILNLNIFDTVFNHFMNLNRIF